MKLSDVLLWRVAEAPARIDQLVRWVRLQWPRVLPDAVGKTLCDWRRRKFLDVGADGKWQIRRGG